MKKTSYVALAIFVSVLCILLGFVIKIYIEGFVPEPPSPTPSVVFNHTTTDDAWILTMSNESWTDCLKDRDITYRLFNVNMSMKLEEGDLQSIKGNASGYNITWLDKDDNNFMSIGDEVHISKAGGADGKAETGYKFLLLNEIPSCVSYEELE